MAPIRHAVSRMMRSLVAKFTVLCGVILIAAISVLLAIQYQTTSKDNRQTSESHAALITELFANGISGHLASGNAVMLDHKLEEFVARQDVAAVYITDAMRRVVASAGQGVPSVGERASGSLLQSAIGAVDTRMAVTGGMIEVAEPVFEQGRLVGAAPAAAAGVGAPGRRSDAR